MAKRGEYEVQIWFATSAGYVTLRWTFPNLKAAEREARSYLSDSRGVRVVDAQGNVVSVVKPHFPQEAK